MSLITWNPSDKNNYIELKDNNMKANRLLQGDVYSYSGVRATNSSNLKKIYYELKFDEFSSSSIIYLGVCSSDSSLYHNGMPTVGDKFLINVAKTSWSIYNGSNILLTKNEESNQGDIFGIAVDYNDKYVRFYKNGLILYESEKNILNNSYIYPVLGIRREGGSATVNFGETKFNITTSNPNEWNNLKWKGYRPFDVDNAKWFNENKHLIKQNQDYYTTNNNYYKLGVPKDKVELKKWLSEYGANNILNLQDSYNNKIVPVDKFSEPRKIYESLDVDFNDVKKPYIYMFKENDGKLKLEYDADNYKIIDEIRKVNNGVGNVVFKEY
ncbi:MAG: SPRY domain-containing protein [Clostridiaceae bacterium]